MQSEYFLNVITTCWAVLWAGDTDGAYTLLLLPTGVNHPALRRDDLSLRFVSVSL